MYQKEAKWLSKCIQKLILLEKVIEKEAKSLHVGPLLGSKRASEPEKCILARIQYSLGKTKVGVGERVQNGPKTLLKSTFFTDRKK